MSALLTALRIDHWVWWALGYSFDVKKYRHALNRAKPRIKIKRAGREADAQKHRAALQAAMHEGQHDRVQAVAEQYARDEEYVHALEVIENLVGVLEMQAGVLADWGPDSYCPPQLLEALTTVVWAAPRCEGVKELEDIRSQIALKLAPAWVAAAASNEEGAANARVVRGLSSPLPGYVVEDVIRKMGGGR